MKYLQFLCLFFPILLFAQTQVPWLLQTEGKSDEFINDMSCDKMGNIYITGNYFDQGLKLKDHFFPKGISFSSSYVAKLNDQGRVIWAKSIIGTTGWSDLTFIDSDDEGNTYLIGSFIGEKLIIGPDSLSNPNKFKNQGVLYLLKFDKNGNLIFSKFVREENEKTSAASGIIVNSVENCIYTLIYTNSKRIQIDSLDLNNKNNSWTQILIKWNIKGKPIWGKVLDHSFAHMGPFDLALDTKDNLYLCGNIYGSWIRLDSSYIINPNNDTLQSSGYLAKINSEGELLWTHVISSVTDASNIAQITIDINNNIYVNGSLRGEKLIVGQDTLFHRNTEPYYWDYYIIKYDPSGNPIWARSLSFGQTLHTGGYMTTDSKGNLFCHWMYNLPEMKLGDFILKNNGTYDNIITKHSPNGNLTWAYGYGGEETESPAPILTDNKDNLIFGCDYDSDGWEFGGHIVKNEFPKDSILGNNISNIFIAKVIPDTTTSLTNVHSTSFYIKAHYSTSDNGVVLDIQGQPQSIDPVIKMYDLSGHELFISASNISSEKYLIEMNKIPNGVYVVKVQFDDAYRSVLVTIMD